jgi:putative sterol carrier protein
VAERKRKPASDSIAEFFAELGRRGHEPLLEKARGTARFDVADGRRTERWLVTIDKGDLRVSRRNTTADCILRVDRSTLERAAAGKLNMMAAVLRGEVTVGGDPRLLVLLRRLFPQPSRRRRSRAARKKQ